MFRWTGAGDLMRRLRILTWHVHGSYLYYLVQGQHDFFLPTRPDGRDGYGGRAGSFRWPDNLHEVPAEDVRRLDLDCIVFQSRTAYFEDQYEILSESQRRLPRIYLEHDPPREHPTDTRHPVDAPEVLLVHVTSFNDLMWDSGRTPTQVIDHGIVLPEGIRYTGELPRGVVVVNDLRSRGRRLGADLFERFRRAVSLDLVGMRSEELGGLGEVPPDRLVEFVARYRFFLHPVRYTSLGLAVCEAMMLGMPIIGLATTELVTVVQNGVSGYVDTDLDRLVERMEQLLNDPAEARRLGDGARRYAEERFDIRRFTRDWDQAFARVTDGASMPPPGAPTSATLGTGDGHAPEIPIGAETREGRA